MRRRANPSRAVRFRWLVTALAFAVTAGAPFLHGSAAKRELALKYYQDAVAQRLDIETVPESKRTPELYQKAIQAFRRVYRTSPQSSKADDSLLAIADIFAQMSERFGAEPGAGDYRAKAVEAYEFLIREYPYSPFLDQARKKAEALRQDASKQQIVSAPAPDRSEAADAATLAKALSPAAEAVAKQPLEVGESHPEATPSPAPPKQALSQITDVRFWSFPESTRVVINLEADPKVQATRLTDPDRVYVDLPNTRLSGESKYRTIAVNDALVKRIRMAQTQTVTRVVIDLNADVEHSTTVLTNPTRLVLELKKPAGGVQPALAAAKPPQPDVAPPVPTPAKRTESAATSRSRASSPAEAPAAEGIAATNGIAPAAGEMKVSAAKPGRDKPGDNKPVEKKSRDNSDGAVATSKPVQPKPIETAAASVPALKPPLTAAAVLAGKAPASTQTEPPAAEPVLSGASAFKPVIPNTTEPLVAPKSARPKAIDSPRASGSSKTNDSPGEIASLPKLAAPKAADPTSRGERDLVRALGLKVSRVVIDAGHGGHDTGTIGPTGLLEKDLTLDVATRLGELIADRIGSEIVYTRTDDTFIPLGERTALANEKGADLFISIHANSSRVRAVRGIETYYLNLTGDREALETAARENASSEKTIHELQDLVSKITLTEKISESREFASQLQRSIYTAVSRENATLRNRGVRTAPFVVLIGARMPSVLAEISFISNPRDEKLLKTPAYRQKIAEALYKGVAGYASGLSSVEVAKR